MPFVAHRVFGWQPVEITLDWNLRDLKLGHAYPLCNTLSCDRCGLVFLDIRFNDEEMASLYSGYRDDRYIELREKYEPGYTARNALIVAGFTYIPSVERFLAKYVPFSPRILDWGGDSGLNTPFRNRAALHHILDISDNLVVPGAVKISESIARSTTYDLIVLSNVLEHVPFPQGLLRKIGTAMQSHTVLYLEVPLEDLMRGDPANPDPYLHKRHWHEHINFFTRTSIELLLETTGFQALEITTIEATVGGKDGAFYLIACRTAS